MSDASADETPSGIKDSVKGGDIINPSFVSRSTMGNGTAEEIKEMEQY